MEIFTNSRHSPSTRARRKIGRFSNHQTSHVQWSRPCDLSSWKTLSLNLKKKKSIIHKPERASRACFNSVSKFLICCWVAFTSSVASPDVPLNFSPFVFGNEVVRPPSPLMVDMSSNLKQKKTRDPTNKQTWTKNSILYRKSFILDRISLATWLTQSQITTSVSHLYSVRGGGGMRLRKAYH